MTLAGFGRAASKPDPGVSKVSSSRCQLPDDDVDIHINTALIHDTLNSTQAVSYV